MPDLHTLRRSRALTFFDLAALSGIPARLLAEAEFGLRLLSRQESDQLALVFGLPPGALRQPAAGSTAILSLPVPARQALAAAALAGAIVSTTIRPADLPRLGAPAPLPAPAIVREMASPPAPPFALAPAASPVVTPASPFSESLSPAPVTPRLLADTRAISAPAPVSLRAFALTAAGPLGCPLQPARGRVVLTQGYGVGTHAPADVWGAVDLAVDGDGDGLAEPGATLGAPVVATHAGVVRATPGSWPAGNHIWVEDQASGWRTGYAHLDVILVESGQQVAAGAVIGLIGNTGMATGPHLDYQVWRWFTNIDPTGLVGGC